MQLDVARLPARHVALDDLGGAGAAARLHHLERLVDEVEHVDGAMLRELDRNYPTARIQPKETIDSTSCDVITLEGPEERLKVFFDQGTGLIKAFEILSEKDRRRRRVVIESWSEEARPMRWAKRLRIEQPRSTLEADYSSVTFDDVAEATFEAPPEASVQEGATNQ